MFSWGVSSCSYDWFSFMNDINRITGSDYLPTDGKDLLFIPRDGDQMLNDRQLISFVPDYGRLVPRNITLSLRKVKIRLPLTFSLQT